MKKFFPVLLVLLAGAAMLVSVTQKTDEGGLQVGDIAPNFHLKGVDGKSYSLDDFPDAKGFIVTFTCNHCPFSVMYEDRIIELHNKYAPLGYPVIAINPNDPAAQSDDSFDKMVERAQEKQFPFVYLLDEGQTIYPQYGAERTPHIFLLDNTRKVRYIGAIDDNVRDASSVTTRYVENAIAALERGEEPDPNFTKAVGCTIKTVN
ncbi:MAG: thioredoxin family protein [Saprospirales bacterium]|nr:thioredoxin family protein [Saprospirales bacterium]MBK8490797.1 thioredoxin family protein [Saprospirales bacterium]